MAEYAISAVKVYKSYKKLQAVAGLSFGVPEASCFSILGPNGAGKTTAMKMIYGKVVRDRHPESSISVLGYDPDKNGLEIRSFCGVVPQENSLDEELTVEQNLDIYARLYGLPAKERRKRIDELLEFMELSDKHAVGIRALSGGMQRRLAIARALMHNPRVLILDEPTTGLDPQVRHHIWDRLRHLKQQGVTILLTTHYMEEAYQISDNILIMHKGEKLIEGPPVELLAENIEGYVLEIVNAATAKELKERGFPPSIRVDESQLIMMLYSEHIDALQSVNAALPPRAGHLRQTNLEDLFLKITGRALHDTQ